MTSSTDKCLLKKKKYFPGTEKSPWKPSLYQWAIFLQCFSWHHIHGPDTNCETCTCRLSFLEFRGIWGKNTEGRRHGGQSASHMVPAGSSLGFLTDQNQQDSLSACSTAGQAAVKDEVLAGHRPGNGNSGVQLGSYFFAIKYQDAFTKCFQLANKIV